MTEIGRNAGQGTPVSLPEKFRDGGILDFGREDALGFIMGGHIFEFQDGETVEVESISGDIGNGWSFTIEAGEGEEDGDAPEGQG
jgi:hypothetical protein